MSGTPGNNSNYIQRYDIEGEAWETADFPAALGDFPVAATSAYLYAIGGDASGGGYWDSQTAVYTYDYASFPSGAWAMARADSFQPAG